MTEETFVRELGRRADDVQATPLTFEDVRGRAHGIRRRRRVAGAVAAAVAVAAVVVPTALLSGGDGRSAPAPATPPARGHAAAVLHAGTVTLPDGSTVPVDVPTGVVNDLGVLTDGRIVVTRNDLMAVQVLFPDGRPQAEYPVAMTTFAMGPTDETVGWVDPDDQVQVLESGSPGPVALGSAPTTDTVSYQVEAVLGTGCADGGCRVLVGDGSTTQELSASGPVALDSPRPLRVSDVSPSGDLWAVTFPPTSQDEQYGCVGVYDPDARRVLARTCDTSNLTFAPDGGHLLGMRGDNNMAGEVTVLDRALRVTGTYSPAPRVVSRAAWADATHVLAVTAGLQDNAWTVVRVGLDGGDPEVVAGPTPGRNPELGPAYLPSS